MAYPHFEAVVFPLPRRLANGMLLHLWGGYHGDDKQSDMHSWHNSQLFPMALSKLFVQELCAKCTHVH